MAMSSQQGGGRGARRRTPAGRERPGQRTTAGQRSGSGGNIAGTRNQRIQRDQPDDDAIEAGRYRARRERNFELPRAVRDELRSVTDGKTAATLERLMTTAAQAYERDRYKEALTAIKRVLELSPESAAARELYGLTLYRLGRWRQAAKELRHVHELTGSLDQHPVIADCERAMGHLDAVTELFEQMRREGVDKEVLVEGRLVMAGTLADAGEIDAAIELLKPAARVNRKSADVSLLREWYALANLFEVAGDLPRARELFHRVAIQAPELLDAPERLRAIR
jgi:tetratricopeptide (TPR) repeat protein